MTEGLLHAEVNRLFRKLGVSGQAAAALMIVFGILILVYQELVAILIGVYLVIVGIVQLVGSFDASRAGAMGGPGRRSAGAPGTGSKPPAGP